MEKKKKEDNNLTFSSITESIKTKLGEEESAKILDDVANILILEKSVNDSIVEKDKTIDKLKSDKNTLKIDAEILYKYSIVHILLSTILSKFLHLFYWLLVANHL